MVEDALSEIAQLKSLADWYRSWAELASNKEERARRLLMAQCLDKQVAAIVSPDELLYIRAEGHA